MTVQKRNLIILTASILVLTLIGPFLSNRPATAASPGDWWGDYFPNPNLSGAPAMSRYDETINFGWGAGSLASGVPYELLTFHCLPSTMNKSRKRSQATFPEAENWPPGDPELAGRLISLQNLSRRSFREGETKYNC